MDLEKIAGDSIREKIAAEVLTALSSEERHAIILGAVERALKEHSYSWNVSKAVAEASLKAAEDYLRTEEGTSLIQHAVVTAVDTFVARLPGALSSAMIEAFAGKDGDGYSRGPGLLLKYLK